MKRYPTPILSATLQGQLDAAIASFSQRSTWKAWGLDRLREQGVAILLWGPAGTGKTTTAHHISKRLGLPLLDISMADYGSQVPGQLARNIAELFQREVTIAREEGRHEGIIFMDECDAMLVSRDRLGPDMIWMMEPINMLLSQIGKYPGLVVLATNHEQILDPALERRLLSRIEFERPARHERLLLWQEKWPKKFPAQPTPKEFDRLSTFDLTGAEIENRFLLWAGGCLINGQDPKVGDLLKSL